MKANGLAIIPAYNEEMNISKILERILSLELNLDIVVVDDGSTDNTCDECKKYKVTVLSHPYNLGYGAAIQTGLKYARNYNYESAIFFDADGQHDSKDIENLLSTLKSTNSDVVIGSRFIDNGEKYTNSIFRKMAINFFSSLISLFTNEKIFDVTSGFQALNKKSILFLSENYPVDFPDADMILLLISNGYKVNEIPATFHRRHNGVSMFSFPRKLYYPFRTLLSILVVLINNNFMKREN